MLEVSYQHLTYRTTKSVEYSAQQICEFPNVVHVHYDQLGKLTNNCINVFIYFI